MGLPNYVNAVGELENINAQKRNWRRRGGWRGVK
jgi:hypothetical protein